METFRFYRDMRIDLPLHSADLTGKIVVIVGASGGIGLEAAKHFAKLKPGRLILACRDAEKGTAVVKDVGQATGYTPEAWPIDLKSFASVSAFVTRFATEAGSLDILVQNAAILTFDDIRTVDGWERTLQINYLSNILLSILLLPYFTKNDPRLLLLNSTNHSSANLTDIADAENILGALNEKSYRATLVSATLHGLNSKHMEQRYAVTKTLVLLFLRRLAQRDGTNSNVTMCAVDPGLCSTHIFDDLKSSMLMRVYFVVVECFARTPEMGSRTILHGALGPPQHGKYLASCKVKRESDFIHSELGKKVGDRIWDETLEVLSKADSRVSAIMDSHFHS